MADFVEFNVKGITQGGWIKESERAWVELETNSGPNLRIIFPDTSPPDLKLRLQQLQAHVAEEREKAGLSKLEHTYVEAVERLEYGKDDVNQIALIRVRFQNGATRDTPIEKGQIRDTIEFLEGALEAFEKLSKSRKH